MVNRTTLFQVYNAGRGMGIEPSRLNRALGICQRRDTSNAYGCTVNRSVCPDGKYRGGRCKHSIAAAMLAAAEAL